MTTCFADAPPAARATKLLGEAAFLASLGNELGVFLAAGRAFIATDLLREALDGLFYDVHKTEKSTGA